MIKLKLLYEILKRDERLNQLDISTEPVVTEETNTSHIQFDPQRIRINFGTRNVYIFGRIENGKWFYFLTVYEQSGELAGPLFWALPGAEEKVLNHVIEQLAIYRGEPRLNVLDSAARDEAPMLNEVPEQEKRGFLYEDDVIVTKEIIQAPEQYFSCRTKSLDERIDLIKLNPEQITQIATKQAKKIIRDKALGFFKIGEVICAVLNWNNAVDKEIREKKKEYLLADYFERTDRSEYALIALKNFLTNPQGNTLFNKILRILDDSPPDIELAGHLASALKYIIDTDFLAMFEEHKYALAQIERFTPQALTILADNANWPVFELGAYSADGPRVTSDWLPEFASAYSSAKNITDRDVIGRIRHSINELISNRIIEANLIGGDRAQSTILDIGKLLLPYVDQTIS